MQYEGLFHAEFNETNLMLWMCVTFLLHKFYLGQS